MPTAPAGAPASAAPAGADPVAAERAAFAADLVAAKVLLPSSQEGIWGRSGAFEAVAQGVSALVVARAAADAATRGRSVPQPWRFPPVMPRRVLERADYLASFPDLVGVVSTFDGGDADHAALLADVAEGSDWTARLRASDVVLCSAACHPYYPTLERDVPAEGLRADVLGICFRHEPSPDPARMQSFRQHEQVFVGAPDAALEHRDFWIAQALDLLGGLGLQVRSEVANDPFFGRAGRLLAAGQRSEALKLEVVATVGSADAPTAIASSNLHRDHFGVAFDLRLPDGEPAHTACVGFGLERITLALFRAHGMDSAAWPADVRGALGL